MTRVRGAVRVGLLGVVLGLAASLAAAQNTVKADQGKPGTQGPWPVTVTFTSADGGSNPGTQPYQCASTSPHKLTSVGTTSTTTPATAASPRAYMDVCVSLENTGSPYIKCRADGVAPVIGAGTGDAGDVLGLGDCIRYTKQGTVLCIASAAATWTTTFECQ